MGTLLKRKQVILGSLLFWMLVLGLSSLYYAEDVSKYLFYDPEAIGERKLPYQWWLIGHFIAASCTLFLGPIQFIPWIRRRFPKYHRTAGKLYIGGSLISAVTVFVLLATTYSLPGAVPSLGFLAVIWIYTTSMAYYSIRRRNIKLHRQFMIRSYVCGLAFVFIRLLPEVNYYTGVFDFIEDDTMRYTVYEWICWVYPIVITEFFLSWNPQMKRLRSR